MVTRSFLDYSRAEAGLKSLAAGRAGWQARAARGSGVAGGPEGHPDRVLLRRRRSTRSGESWGGSGVRADQEVPARAAADARPRVDRPAVAVPVAAGRADANPDGQRGGGGGGERQAAALTTAERQSGRQSRTIVAPSPPSPRSPAGSS